MLNILIYSLGAIVVAWIVTDLFHNRGSLVFNIIVGLIGVFLAGYFLTPYFHVPTINAAVNLKTSLVTLLGVVVLLLVFNFSRGSRHKW
jgi:uncharacterized membrane protein YeaQ/YmgE (transglycosylase-associated protein family)